MSNKKTQVDPSNTKGTRSETRLVQYQIRHEKYGLFQGVDSTTSEVVWHRYNGQVVGIYSIQFKSTGEEIMCRISDLTGIPYEELILEEYNEDLSYWLARGLLFNYGKEGYA